MKTLFLILLTGFVLSQCLLGAPIIANGSFETNTAPLTWSCCPTGTPTQLWNYAGSDSWSYQGSVGAWKIGLYTVGSTLYFTNPYAGSDIAFLEDTSSLWQAIATPSPNTTYTFTIYVGHRQDDGSFPASAYQIGFYDGSSWLASVSGTSGTVAKGTWSPVTVSFTTPGNFSGPLYVRVNASAPAGPTPQGMIRSQLLVDGASVNAAPLDTVPEPLTMALIGGGLGAIALVSKRRRV